MIEMHSKYDKMHINGMFYALFCINNHVLSCVRLHVINKGGQFNAIVLPPQSYNQGPLTRGPSKYQPTLPRGATRASTWTRVAPATCPHHLAPPERRVGLRGSAMWPCVPCHIHTGPAHHVSSACHVSSAGPAENKPLFAILIKE